MFDIRKLEAEARPIILEEVSQVYNMGLKRSDGLLLSRGEFPDPSVYNPHVGGSECILKIRK